MRIVLNDESPLSVGSTRIHIHNLAYYLNAAGAGVVKNDWSSYEKYDVAIFGKNVNVGKLTEARHQNPRLKIGRVNPTDRAPQKQDDIVPDFFVAGCIQERDYYMKFRRPILIFPHIELFGEAPKTHIPNEGINIGYHGNETHINLMSSELISALSRLAERVNIVVTFLYNVEKLGKARISSAFPHHHVQWELDRFAEQIQEFDIGIVPNLNRVPSYLLAIMRKLPTKSGGLTDLVVRYKNTENAGRAFVFYQLGIPVVADMAPSHFHILGNPQNGYLAMSEEGWYQALYSLAISADHRNEIAANAHAEFRRLYDPGHWAELFLRQLETVCEG